MNTALLRQAHYRAIGFRAWTHGLPSQDGFTAYIASPVYSTEGFPSFGVASRATGHQVFNRRNSRDEAKRRASELLAGCDARD